MGKGESDDQKGFWEGSAIQYGVAMPFYGHSWYGRKAWIDKYSEVAPKIQATMERMKANVIALPPAEMSCKSGRAGARLQHVANLQKGCYKMHELARTLAGPEGTKFKMKEKDKAGNEQEVIKKALDCKSQDAELGDAIAKLKSRHKECTDEMKAKSAAKSEAAAKSEVGEGKDGKEGENE